MLTSILKTRTLAGFVLTYTICGLLLAFCFCFRDLETSTDEFLFSHWAFSWAQNHKMALGFLGIILLAFAGVVSRVRTAETKLAFGSSNITMTLLVAIALVQSPTVFSRPDALVAMVISTTMFLLLGYTYKKESTLSEFFHVGLLLGIGCLFVGQTILLLLAVGFSLMVLRTGNWKEWAVLFLGFCMAAVFLMMFTIWNETPLLEFQRVIQSAWSGGFGITDLNAGHAILVVALLAALAGMFGSLTQGTVTERNLSLSNLAWIISIVIMTLLLGLGWQQGIILAAFPLSVSVTRTIERIERWWLADLLLVTILSAPIVSSLWRF